MTTSASPYDADAGFTELLRAVAIRRYEAFSGTEIAMTTPAEAGVATPYEVDRWACELGGFDEADVHCMVYVVAPDEYRSLSDRGIKDATEIDWFDFVATPEEVAAVRSATPSPS